MLHGEGWFRLNKMGDEDSDNPLEHGYFIPLTFNNTSQINNVYEIFGSKKIFSESGINICEYIRPSGRKMNKIDRISKFLRFNVYSTKINTKKIPVSMTPDAISVYNRFIDNVKHELSLFKFDKDYISRDDFTIDENKIKLCNIVNRNLVGKGLRSDEFLFNKAPILSKTMEIINDVVRVIKIEYLASNGKKSIKKLVKDVLDKRLLTNAFDYKKITKRNKFYKNKFGALIVRN